MVARSVTAVSIRRFKMCCLVSLILAGVIASANAKDDLQIKGSLTRGDTFHYPIGRGLFLWLLPDTGGWTIQVGPDKDQDFARVVTPPLHGPHPQDILAWHFVPEKGFPELGLKRLRQFQFVLNQSAFDAELSSLNEMYTDVNRRDYLNTLKHWQVHKMGHCWLRPDKVILTDVGGKDESINLLQFTAECTLFGSKTSL